METKVEMVQLGVAIKSLNEAGLASFKVKVVGVSNEEKVKQFLMAVETIKPEDEGKTPDIVGDVFNSLRDEEDAGTLIIAGRTEVASAEVGEAGKQEEGKTEEGSETQEEIDTVGKPEEKPEKKTKEKKEKLPKKEKESKRKTKSRYQLTAEIIKGSPQITLEELIKKSNEDYISLGGENNLSVATLVSGRVFLVAKVLL
jgi:hypothetical protein